MENYLPVLEKVSLFAGIAPGELLHLLRCLQGAPRRYGKGELLWQMGDTVTHVGVVLSGAVEAAEYGPDGTEHLAACQSAGSVIGDLLVAADAPSPVTLRAQESTAVLFLPLDGILGDCGRGCEAHVRLRRNLLRETARKYWQARDRLRYLREARLEDRVLLFLRDQPPADKSGYITVPYTRAQMAALLGANRSALSRTLGQMEKKGLISYYRDTFRLNLLKNTEIAP